MTISSTATTTLATCVTKPASKTLPHLTFDNKSVISRVPFSRSLLCCAFSSRAPIFWLRLKLTADLQKQDPEHKLDNGSDKTHWLHGQPRESEQRGEPGDPSRSPGENDRRVEQEPEPDGPPARIEEKAHRK